MDFKTEILPWVQGLALPISILTAAGAYYYRTRVEHQRMANRVLFYLLELRHSFRILNAKPKGLAKEFTQVYLDGWKAQGVDLNASDVPGVEVIEGLINQMVESLMAKGAALPDDFLPSFRGALNSLSERDPISAFRINGSENLNMLFEAVEHYNQQAKAAFSENEIVQLFISKLEEDGVLENVEHPITELDDIIRALSRRCSWRTRWKVRKILKKKELKLSEDDLEEMRNSMGDAIKELIPKILEIAKSVEAEEAEKLEASSEAVAEPAALNS